MTEGNDLHREDGADLQFEERVRKAIAKGVPMELEKVDLALTFGALGLQSLDIINIIFALEDEFGVEIAPEDFDVGSDPAAFETQTIRTLVDAARAVIEREPAAG